MPQRRPIDIQAYLKNIQQNPCFICEMVAGNLEYQHHILYEDETAIVFLNKYPTLYGYILIAPREHREQVIGDFTLDEYLALQQLIYRVGETLRQEVPTERLYVLSLGSQQALSAGQAACTHCGRLTLLKMGMPQNAPPVLRHEPGFHLTCSFCGTSSSCTLRSLALEQPETLQFWQANPQIQTLPQRELNTDGHPATGCPVG